MSIWRRLCQPHSSILCPELRQRTQLLSSVLLVLLPGAAAAAVLPQQTGGPFIGKQIALVGFLGLVVAYGISRTRHFQLATTLTLAVSISAVLLSGISSHQPEHLNFLIFVPLLGCLFLSPFVTALVTLGMAGLVLGLPIADNAFQLQAMVPLAFLLILTGALATVAAWRQTQYIQQLQHKSADLAGQNLQLLNTHRALGASQAQLANILQNAAEAVIALDADQKIVLFNAGAEATFGYAAQEMLGQPLDRLLPKRAVNRHRRQVAAFGSEPQTGRPMAQRAEVAGRRKDGTEFPAEIGISTYVAEGRLVYTAIVINITARQQHQHEIEAVALVSAALRRAVTRASMLPIVLDQLSALLGAAGSGIALCNEGTGEVNIELGRGAWAPATGDRRVEGQGLTAPVMANGQAYVVHHVKDDPRVARPDLLGDIQSVAVVPLVAQEQTFGAMWMGKTIPITKAEVSLLTAIAEIAANAIYRATLHEQTERRLERLGVLRAIDEAISNSLDLRVTLAVILDQVTTRLHLDAADILMANPYAPILEFAAGRGFHTRVRTGSTVRLGESLAGRAVLDRRIVHVPVLAAVEPALTRADRLDGEGFITYLGTPLIADDQVVGVLEVFQRARFEPDGEWLEFMEALASRAAIAIEKARLYVSLQHSKTQLAIAYDATIEGWSQALDLRDHETEGHSLRVTEMAVRLARAMGLDEQQLVHVRRGALLHDIGKMGIPDQILLKPGQLTDHEWDLMRLHPVYAYRLLKPIPYLQPALNIPYCHHEKWDGTGYPQGLRGEQIPLSARIFTVVDVWDALTSNRLYRAAWPPDKVRAHLRAEAGQHFDPDVVGVFLREVVGESASNDSLAVSCHPIDSPLLTTADT